MIATLGEPALTPQPAARRGPRLPGASIARFRLLDVPAPAAKPAPDALPHKPDNSLVETLSRSRLFQDYERAFTEATGMPVAIRPVESWQLPHHGKRSEGPFCKLMSERSATCACCLQNQEKLTLAADREPHTVFCASGLCDTAVPVRLGERLVGFLQTGQVFQKPPTEAQFKRLSASLEERGIKPEPERLREAYFATHVVPSAQHASIVRLLSIFAEHLAMLSNQIVVRRENAEPPAITRAKEYIEEHQTETLRLGAVAKAAHTSPFYFCKMFHKATGLNFTDYVARLRIEKAKNLLLNPNLRISEIGFEAGFQSLTHFNRVFRNVVGESPTDYRAHLSR
jgi:AraC-like DNA-binding protein/ligand-binding sensor protein